MQLNARFQADVSWNHARGLCALAKEGDAEWHSHRPRPGGEAVKEPGVGRAAPARQRRADIHDGQVEGRAHGVEVDPMKPAGGPWPLAQQRCREVFKLRPRRQSVSFAGRAVAKRR